MKTLANLSATQLARASELKTQIESLETELNNILGEDKSDTQEINAPPASNGTRRKHNMSPEGRRAIIRAQKRRWAKQNGAAK